jgi:hypothetical protein
MAGESEPWHLDKRVPIALLLAIIGQTFLIGSWVAAISKDVEQSKQENIAQDIVIEAIRADAQLKSDRFAEVQRALSEQLVEQRGDLRAIRELMQRIEGRLDAHPQPRRP